MALDRPVHAVETADGGTAPAVALHVAPGSAVHDGLAQMFTPPPPPPIFGLHLDTAPRLLAPGIFPCPAA